MSGIVSITDVYPPESERILDLGRTQDCGFDPALLASHLRPLSHKEQEPVDLLCRPLHLAGIEIVIAFDYPHLSRQLAELGLTPNLLRDLSVIFTNSIR